MGSSQLKFFLVVDWTFCDPQNPKIIIFKRLKLRKKNLWRKSFSGFLKFFFILSKKNSSCLNEENSELGIWKMQKSWLLFWKSPRKKLKPSLSFSFLEILKFQDIFTFLFFNCMHTVYVIKHIKKILRSEFMKEFLFYFLLFFSSFFFAKKNFTFPFWKRKRKKMKKFFSNFLCWEKVVKFLNFIKIFYKW